MKTRIRHYALAVLRGSIATALGLFLGASMIASATSLADQPVFSTSQVPGNMALALSVEWPTASRMAHVDAYTSASTYLGYFDPNKCYLYQTDATANGINKADGTSSGDKSNFYPQGLATNRQCTGANDAKWSGNFLNWASTPTIDPFRWAMTGGRRVVDTVTDTILEKAWHSGQGLFNDRDLTVSEIAGATPFNGATRLGISINNRGFKMRLSPDGARRSMLGEYFNNTGMTGTPTLTVNNDTVNNDWGNGSPGAGISNNNFSARFTGTLAAPDTGNYVFRATTRSDDGVRLYVNNILVIDNWTGSGNTVRTVDSFAVSLAAGQSVPIRVEYLERSQSAQMQLLWQIPSTPGVFNVYTDDAGARDYTMRVKVCDPSAAAGGLEGNCKAYGSNYKPEGLIQKYSQKMRFSAFGYLNDDSGQRDGGVLRARQKFVGPTYPVPGQAPSTNTLNEWSASTGQLLKNPDSTDAATTQTATGVTVSDSGVMNYLNHFGQLIPGNYKSYDPVSELYYAALRYYRNLGDVGAWSNTSGAPDTATKRKWVDGFPVITNWGDPVQYACQRNFVLGIGDIYTWNDKNVAGNNGTYTSSEPGVPTAVSSDNTVNAITATNKVGALQGLGATLGATNSYSGRDNSAYIAGLAYDANTKDIRTDLAGSQTVQTYWVDVLEQPFQANNQFYLAAKFGGLNQKKLPVGFDPYTFAGTIPDDWWSTSGETLTDTRTNTTQKRPDNYFAAGRPDTMVAGLTRAFESIANAIEAYTTSFSLSTVEVSSLGAASYASKYDANGWTGTLIASELTFDSSGNPTSSTLKWSSATTLQTQLAGAGWDTNRRVATWNGSAGAPFRIGNLTTAQANALDTAYVGGDDRGDYLNYLRGDRSKEKTDTDTTKPYRKRPLLLGDIVNAKVTPVGPPAKALSDAINPGYAAFKTAKASRPTMVYVGANDGMLHAFNGALTGTGAGAEQFAYVPSALFQGPTGAPQTDGLAQLGNPNYLHHNYVDATPKVFDIDFNSAGGSFTTTSAGTSDWRSVLIGGLGKGGRSYYAIDVSDPASMTSESAVAGKVLWEFTDSTMGYGFGAPTVVKTKKYGWVVVLTSGYNNSDGNGYLYFVNPKTGALLEKVSTGAASNGLTHASAYVQDFSDLTADAIYAGDLNGQLWRFDVTAPKGSTAPYAAATKLATVTDGAATPKAQPITTPPLIEIQPQSRKRFVMFGTGQLLDTSDIGSTAGQSFYAIIDGSATGFSPASATMPITRSQLTQVSNLATGATLPNTSLGWYLDLGTDSASGVGWRLVTTSATFSGIVAFAPLLTTGDACSPSGKSRLYAIDFANGQSVLTPAGTTVAFSNYDNAITDVKFLGVDRTARLVTGDVVGQRKRESFALPSGLGVRLLNWREVPAVD